MGIAYEKKLGFGAMRLPLSNPDDPKHIDLAQVSQMVDLYLDRGFSYFDTVQVAGIAWRYARRTSPYRITLVC